VTGIPTAEYPTPAPRPLNSRLDCTKIERTFGISPPDWRTGLDRTLTELRDA
jgi:dTDP-4-dehydrorhamnose reductase